VDFGLVPNLRYWRVGEDNLIQSCYTVEDTGLRTMNDGTNTNTGGIREVQVLTYKEKRQTHLFSRDIEYEVRNMNAEKRPQMKVYPFTSTTSFLIINS